ncbi:MAG: hypothetical protein E2581_13515 [Pseudomonas sp.]|uniref:hypothetical protein n=1 Tax=Pseudomonas sp. TaxID=306 RepID=UPI001D717723|nr:hypothetical protein [Pseudomonas sp.]MPS99502.1 hypothetical protein [Pseudomonas sp.]
MTPPIQLQRLPRRKKPALRKRASLLLGLAALVVLLLLALSGCSQAGAQEPQTTATAQELKRAAAGKWLCPGMHAEWISNTEVQCLKERI